jgi:hypothetical protein
MAFRLHLDRPARHWGIGQLCDYYHQDNGCHGETRPKVFALPPYLRRAVDLVIRGCKSHKPKEMHGIYSLLTTWAYNIMAARRKDRHSIKELRDTDTKVRVTFSSLSALRQGNVQAPSSRQGTKDDPDRTTA